MKWLQKLFPLYTKEISIGILVLIMLLSLQLLSGNKREAIKTINRPEFMEGDTVTVLYYQGMEKENQITVDIEQKEPTAGESHDYLINVKDSFNEYIKSQNDNFQDIRQPLYLPDSYKKCSIVYQFISPTLIDNEGWLMYKNFEETEIIKIIYKISYNSISVEDAIILTVSKSAFSSAYLENYMDYQLEREVYLVSQNIEDEVLLLPDEVVFYNNPKSVSLLQWMGYIILLIIGGVFISRGELERKKKQCMKTKRIQLTYFINNFVLLFQAGMTIQKSFYLATNNRIQSLDKKEEIYLELNDLHKMEAKEISFYDRMDYFSEIFNMMEGRRFSRLIIQNMKQGDHLLSQQLEQLSTTMWEERIRHARKESEKASSKLVFPMVIIFIIILVITIVPTLIEVNQYM